MSHTLDSLPPLYTGRTAHFDPEWDTVYGIDADSNVYAPDGLYAPEVYNDETHDVVIDGMVWHGGPGDHWQALTGHTGQYSYRGAVMHPSEQFGPWALRALSELADAPDVAYVAFAVTEVLDSGVDADGDAIDDGDPIGWAVVYRPIPA